MNFNPRIHCFCAIFLTIIFVYQTCSDSDTKSSLTFVIDSTNSMKSVINQVKDGANAIFDVVANSVDSPIDNFILATFADPNATININTRNKTEFQSAISSVYLTNGADCPEYCMKGIKMGLEESLPESYIYVFTDATAKDFDKLKEVQNIALKKGCQVVFVLTGSGCRESNSTVSQVYYNLATATSGQVFHMESTDDDTEELSMILEYVKNTVESRKIIMGAKKFPPGDRLKLNYTIDSKINDTVISTSGECSTLALSGPNGDRLKPKKIVDWPEATVMKVSETKPGVYTFTFTCRSDTYIVVSGTSELRFRHGFSTFVPSSIGDTTRKPIPNVKSHLSIKLTDGNFRLLSMKLLDVDENVIMEKPLVLSKENKLFITDPFEPPKGLFKISVTGIDLDTNSTITRLGATMVEVQDPDAEPVKDLKPSVSIYTESNILIKYNEPLQLKCRVRGYPRPEIFWRDKDSGKPLSATVYVRDLPYDYISILEIAKVTKNASYECVATTKLHKDSKIVTVKTKQDLYLRVEKPTDTTIKYNSEGKLHCKVDAYPPAEIYWYKYKKYRRLIPIRVGIKIYSNGSLLTIKEMKKSDAGIFLCVAENAVGKKMVAFRVSVSGVEMPTINKTLTNVYVKDGSGTNLTCSVLAGKPKPHIEWFIKRNPSGIYKEFVEARDQRDLSLRNLNIYDTATYMCKAKNVIGQDNYEVDVIVESPPNIYEKNELIVAKSGEEIPLIKCTVTGTPTPTVTWLKDGAPISTNIHVYSDYSFKLVADKDKAGEYSCNASNKLGSAIRIVNITEYTLHITPPRNSTRSVTVNNKMSLTCDATGVPPPEIQWQFYRTDSSPLNKIIIRPKIPQNLIRRKIKPEDSGYYVCVASNIGGSVNITYTVYVKTPPKILEDIQKQFRVVEGDRLLTIPCKAKGYPKPEITFTKNGVHLDSDDRFEIDEDLLIIKNISSSDSAGTYVCTASNIAGADNEEIEVIVERYPSPYECNTTKYLVEKGTNAIVNCFVFYDPGDVLRWYKNSAKIHDGTLTLTNAQPSDSGLYTCRSCSIEYSTSYCWNTEVVVGTKPRFVNVVEESLQLGLGEAGNLNCEAEGEPKPKATWLFGDKELYPPDMVKNFKMNTKMQGRYYCTVSNEFGSINRTFDLSLKDCFIRIDAGAKNQPLLLTSSATWPIFENRDGFLLVPKGQRLMFSCPKKFAAFDQQTIITSCETAAKFKINGGLYDYSDINCSSEVKPRVQRTGKPCMGYESETIKIVFEVLWETVELFEVCLDGDGVPIYTKHNLWKSLSNTSPRDTSLWDSTPAFDQLYNCTRQRNAISGILNKWLHRSDESCFERKLLVNPKNMFPGVAQRATFTKYNVVPHWSYGHAENWNDLEYRVRRLAKSINNNLIIWTGTFGTLSLPNNKTRMTPIYLDKVGGRSIPLYLWKVVQNPASKSSIAIVQLNIPDIKPSEVAKYIKCKDICKDTIWMNGTNWYNVDRGYTYCCTIGDFSKAFNFKKVFESGLERLLSNV